MDIDIRKVIIVVKGHPFTGKTTLAVALANWLNCTILLVDEIIDELPFYRDTSTGTNWSSRRERLYSFALEFIVQIALSHVRSVPLKGIALVIDFPFVSKSHLDRFIKSIRCSYFPCDDVRVVLIDCNVQNNNKYAWKMRFEEEHHREIVKRYWYKPQCWEQVEKVITTSSEYIPDDNDYVFKDLLDNICVSELVLDPFIDVKLTDLLYPPEEEVTGYNFNRHRHIPLFYEAIKHLVLEEEEGEKSDQNGDVKLTDLLNPPEEEVTGYNFNRNQHIPLFYEANKHLVLEEEEGEESDQNGEEKEEESQHWTSLLEDEEAAEIRMEKDEESRHWASWTSLLEEACAEAGVLDEEMTKKTGEKSDYFTWTFSTEEEEVERRGLPPRRLSRSVVKFRQWKRNRKRQQNDISSSDHSHSLTRYEKGGMNYDSTCATCQNAITAGSPAYTCEFCSLTLHKSCAELAQVSSKKEEMSTASFKPVNFVQSSSLDRGWIYDFRSDKKRACDSCSEEGKLFSYSCESCLFEMHIRNPRIPTIIRHQGHEHFLSIKMDPIIINRVKSIYRCAACGLPGVYGSYYCPICDVHYHCECANVPLKLKYRHVGYDEPLMLKVKSEVLEDYLCDVCEKKRDPECWFYYCEECDYAAHTYCVVDYPTYILDLTFSGFVV